MHAIHGRNDDEKPFSTTFGVRGSAGAIAPPIGAGYTGRGMIRRPALFLAAALAVLASRPEPPSAQTGWELNVHGATLLDDLFPESGGSIQAGARLVHTTPWRLTVGGNFDWARTQEVVLGGTGDVSADLVLVSGEIGYAAPVSPRTDLMLAAGAGSAMVRLYDIPVGTSLLEESSGLLIPIGAGIRFRNRPEAATWAIRADLRDQIIFLDVVDPTSGEVDPEPRHNWEISAGVSLLFGGSREREETPTPRPAVEARAAAPPPWSRTARSAAARSARARACPSAPTASPPSRWSARPVPRRSRGGPACKKDRQNVQCASRTGQLAWTPASEQKSHDSPQVAPGASQSQAHHQHHQRHQIKAASRSPMCPVL